MRVDTVVLDLDGVVVDVSRSYRRAIRETAEHLTGTALPEGFIQALKNAGGFNDDWELTDAGVLYLLARRTGYDAPVDAFAEDVAAEGGGLGAARAVIREATGSAAEADWDPAEVRGVFQALYLGAERFRELEGDDPPVTAGGYIEDENVLIDEATVVALTERFRLGVLTGRPGTEAAIALRRAGLDVPPDHRVTMDDDAAKKPDPAGLIALAERLDSTAVAFVGDSLDDIRTTVNARDADAGRTYRAVGVLTGGLDGREGRRLFEATGADAVLATVNELPELLRPVDRPG